jgi:hypothetical protein
VLIVFSLHRESLKLILATDPLPKVVLSHQGMGFDIQASPFRQPDHTYPPHHLNL